METKGLDYLRKKLNRKKNRVKLRYKFYEMKNITIDFNISTPPKLRNWSSVLGWCSKSVDTLADRLQFKEFYNDEFNINEIFRVNNPDVFFDSAILSSLISSCCFIYISEYEGRIRLQVVDGENATGIIDEFTGLLTEGYAILQKDNNNLPVLEAYFTKEFTYFYKYGKEISRIKNYAPYPLLVPIIHRPDAKRPFGHSRISRACMSIMDSALRTIKRSEISAEFFSFPQRYITGLSADAETLDKWKASMSSLLSFTKDEEGDSPTLGQFTQQSMQPHVEQLRMFASLFAAETGLTLDDLGFVSDNPTSAEAIKASHENLRLMARKCQRTFGSGFLNVGYLACCIRDKIPYERHQFINIKPKWEPVFEPDSASLSSIGDSLLKLNQAIEGYVDEKLVEDLTGIKKDK